MIDWWRRAAWSAWARASRLAERNRRELYGESSGLRMVALHDIPLHDLDRFKRLVGWCQEHYPIAGPEAAVELAEGRYEPGLTDRLLFTFDDGMGDNYEAARHLNERGICAIFFVIPSLIDRTVGQFRAYHGDHGVDAYWLRRDTTLPGLSQSQVREMSAMGHLIAGHNFAHRDLGTLRREDELDYEIGRAMDTLSRILGRPCEDFAFGFGRPNYVSAEASAYMNRHCRRVYACVRGLNVPGRTPRYFLRDHIDFSFPAGFIRSCLEGALDRRAQPQWAELTRMAGLLPASGEPANVHS